MNNDDTEELIINFEKLFKIVFYRKTLIIKAFCLCLLFFILLTFIVPKKYKTDADIYVNKSNNTNLVELNPYMISAMSSAGGGFSSLFAGTNTEIQNNIEVMTSPLVMDNVIKENNLKYKKGKKKGELLSTKDFLKKNISIENKKGTNVISINYKSDDPILSYNVVNSIIKNFGQINENINTKKAMNDKKLLEASYAETTKSIDKKISAMKSASILPDTSMNGLGMLAALRGHHKGISGAMNSIKSQVIEGQKAQISLEEDTDKLQLVKSKLEWTKLVEQMSKDTTNVIVLKQPEIKRSFEQSSPKLWINLLIGSLLGFLACLIAIIGAEKTDKKLTYSDLNDKIIYNLKECIDDLKLTLFTNDQENFLIVYFDGADIDYLKNIGEVVNFKIVKADINPNILKEISNSQKLIFMAKVGLTPKKLFKQIKNVCEENKKNICLEIV